MTLIACSTQSNDQKNSAANKEPLKTDSVENPDNNTPSFEPIIGERIDGPANIRDTINGKLLFTLYDNTLVTCTPVQNDWYVIGLTMDIDTSEYEINELKKGRKIIVDGEEIGEILSDFTVSTGTNYKMTWAELVGYTHKDNIKPNVIIESVLPDYITEAGNDRTIKSLEPLIENFELAKDDQFDGYTVYYNYENWIDDPSPMWRIGLTFRDDRLIAILHSRPIDVEGTTDHKLDRGFGCLTFNDIENADDIINMFNRFVNSVD